MPILSVNIQKSRWGIRGKTSVSDNGTSTLHFPQGMVNAFLLNSAGQNCLKELVAAILCAGNTLKLSGCRNRFLVPRPFLGSYFVVAPGRYPSQYRSSSENRQQDCLSSKVRERSGTEQLLLHRRVHLTTLLPSSPDLHGQDRLQV